ncbi:MAG: rod shape-determining protein MreD [Eubacterium sp.]|nr:rod shape-determining protein MreD [Eubacterium sp.]MCR4845530.1 rod shape-determining protein MreD [Eubacterium sp.]
MRRIISIFILIILSFLLQSVLFSFQNVRGIAPNLLLILTMSFGIMRGRREGMLTGFFCGFLYDIFFGTLIGPYMFLFMIIGYLNGAFHKEFLMEDVMMPVIIIIVDELFFNFVIYIATFLLRNRTNLFFYLTHVMLPQMLFTALATIIIYRFYVWINKYLKKKVEENEVV